MDDQTNKSIKVDEDSTTPPAANEQKQEETDKPEKSEKSEDQNVGMSENSESQKAGNLDSTSPSDHSDSSDASGNSEVSDSSDLSDLSDSSDTSDSSEPSGLSDKSDSTKSSGSPRDQRSTMNDKRDVPGAHWYVVHTYSGHEAKVAATLRQRVESQQLQDKVLDILVPTQDKIEIKEGKKSKVKEKIFPGYLLIRMVLDDNTWLVVRTTPGITSFVGMGNKPTPLPDEEVATIQRFMTMEAPKFKAAFSVGEAIKIVDGPFSEFLGSISEIDEERGKIKVLVSIFGRETPVELDFLQVAKL